ncbi:sulfotransferase [Ideonella sp. 4Y11]|uniref:Sulfotransferase n=1 Tax=Ideonella aquatica TaxID=2824119 RepID=A0A940YKD2_9BURK|nr:sulfotransferase [Ideonella aquatica]MBQ0959464.1 sulfotransferase [Ideonella aquatica]
MKLDKPFIKLPFQFDAERLAQEVQALPPQAWVSHPNAFDGNTACRLITVDGAENDDVTGRMAMTPHLQATPYIRQVLAHFGVVWGRSRLMRLAPGAKVPEHADMNYHWFSRVRVHIPVLTRPGVKFWCEDECVYMAPGEAWIFDNWRLHRVENDTDQERIHLVADTSGSAAFWNMARGAHPAQALQHVGFQPGREVSLALERYNTFRVMPPSELESLLADLAADLAPKAAVGGTVHDVANFQSLLRSFCHDWRQLWALYADSDDGLEHFRYMAQALREVTQGHGDRLVMRSNQAPTMRVLMARVARYLVSEGQAGLLSASSSTSREAAPVTADTPQAPPTIRRELPRQASAHHGIAPVFIIAAPRSGSTLLFETLASTPQWWTVGGEAHWLVEGYEQFAPGSDGLEDNRLDASHASPALAADMAGRLRARLRSPQGQPLPTDAGPVRVLEKTPKNALRVPFFAQLFPHAKFVFLWRDPWENISSIIDAWQSGGWVTYSNMPDWDGDWSLLLPPGWRKLRGRPLAEVATFQWKTTNTMALDDLSNLAPERWMAVNYRDLTRQPGLEVQRICNFAGIAYDDALQARVSAPLPPSRHTLGKPHPEKWRKNEDVIRNCVDQFSDTWERLKSLR